LSGRQNQGDKTSAVTREKHAYCHGVIIMSGSLMTLVGCTAFRRPSPRRRCIRSRRSPTAAGTTDDVRQGTVGGGDIIKVALARPFFECLIRPLEISRHTSLGPAPMRPSVLGIMHAKRLTDPDTGPELKGRCSRTIFVP
jgi:hypothetical protein